MSNPETNSVVDLIRAGREYLAQEISAQAEKLEKLELDIAELRAHHQRMGQDAEQRWEEISRAPAVTTPPVSPDATLENVLGAVRGLMTCTIPEQVLQILTEEAAQLGIRAAIFDVRGKAAWGAAANGFGPELTGRSFQALIIPLNQENPFRQVCETAGPIDTNAGSLKRNRNLLDKLKPAAGAPILLLPVRSGGMVSAIFYADPGGTSESLPVNALKILSEFAGAQLDRLIALSGVIPEMAEELERPAEAPAAVPEPIAEVAAEPAPPEAPVAEEPAAPTSPEAAVEATPVTESPAPAVEATSTESRVEETTPTSPVAAAPTIESPAPAIEATSTESWVEETPPTPPVDAAPAIESPAPEPPSPVIESDPTPVDLVTPEPVSASEPLAMAPAEEEPSAALATPASAAPADVDISQLSEADQKLHKDARRFAKLLVSEIELYNKTKVGDGRKNKDLYRRMKADIERSRQTFDKRFGKTLGKEFDYFDDELVKTLAGNDPSVLGPEYPGPSA